MQVKQKEFADYGRATLLSDTAAGLWLVQYTPIEKPEPAERKPQKTYCFYEDEICLNVYVKVPQPREVLRTAIVQRTSHNVYKVTYADKLGCETATVKSYDEVHAFLKPLWRRSLAQ